MKTVPEVDYAENDKVILYTSNVSKNCKEFYLGKVIGFGVNPGKQRTVRIATPFPMPIDCDFKSIVIGWADLAYKLPKNARGVLWIQHKEKIEDE